MQPEQVEVVVVDDHPAILAGLNAWFAAAGIVVVAAGTDPEIAWTEVARDVRVVVLDLQLDGQLAAFGTLRRLVDAGRDVIVYSMREDPETALTAIEVGAFTYLTKAEGEKHLVAAIRAAAARRPYLAPALAGAMVADARPGGPRLAGRETQVLLEWFRSESKEMVAAKLGLSPRTVASYLDRVRIKYADAGRPAPTKAALVARAIQDGLIDPSEL